MINNASLQIKKNNAKKIVDLLKKRYGNEALCHLVAKKDYEFLFSVILSAQCTDERVNKVTKDLYKKYNSLKAFAKLNVKELEKEIYSIGFYHNKAKNIILCANELIDRHNGIVPNDFNQLINLSGVGRKTANVVLGHLFNIPSMAVDTHVNRISNKLFALNEKDPDKVEELLKQIINKKYWVLWNTHIIAFGREICIANRPKCDICFLKKYCEYYNK